MKIQTSLSNTPLILTLFLGISCIMASCMNNSQSETFDIPKPITDANNTSILLNDTVFIPETTEAFLKKQEGKFILTLASYKDNSEGIFLEIKTEEQEQILGSHSLLEHKNRASYNETDSLGIATFYSHSCSKVQGEIVIKKYDKKKNTITGYVNTRVCANGDSSVHTLSAQFKNIKVLML